MARTAELIYSDGLIFLDLSPDSAGPRVSSDPDGRDWPFYFYYDDEKLADGEREFVGLEVLDISNITNEWLAHLDTLDLPRVDIPEADLFNATVADVLRWARETYPRSYSSATA